MESTGFNLLKNSLSYFAAAPSQTKYLRTSTLDGTFRVMLTTVRGSREVRFAAIGLEASLNLARSPGSRISL